MSTLFRIGIALVLLGVAAFCVFGFMATYEPPTDANMPLRVIYGLIGIGCLGAVWLTKCWRLRA